jgi:thioredoxin reductase (NADPH)
MVDVVIVGGGVAGISSAIESQRRGMKNILIEKNELGGTLDLARKIENFPPLLAMSGKELKKKFNNFFTFNRLNFLRDEVVEIILEKPIKIMTASNKTIVSKCAIIATGQKDCIRKEYADYREFINFPSSLNCFKFKEKEIIVFGGGDVAFDVALNISERGGEVKLFARSFFKAKNILIEEAKERRISLKENIAIKSINKESGEKIVVSFENVNCSFKNEYCDFLFFCIGREPNLPKIESGGKRITLKQQKFLQKNGLFFAGDVISGTNRNVGVAIGSGLTASIDAYRFCMKG